jgi:phosphoribosylanthranilate isomerase
VFVKICGLTSEAHVRTAVEAGADAIGFVFAESVRRIDPAHAARISRDVPGNVKRVAVMLHPSNDEWQEVLRQLKPNVLQTDAEDFADLDVPLDVTRWPVCREGDRVTGPLFVYEGAKSGQGETVDWSAAAEVARNGNMILAGGLGIENVAGAIATVRPYGVDVSSGVESAPGQKDSEKIREFIKAAKAAGNNL